MSSLKRRKRKGNIIVLSAVLMVALMAMLAFAVDLGCICVAREELQRTADAAAMAGAWELIDDAVLSGSASQSQIEQLAHGKATYYASLNPIFNAAPTLDTEDVEVGYLSDPTDPNLDIDTTGVSQPNAVRVRVRRTSELNGEVPLFFARALGLDKTATEAEATAALLSNFKGFRKSTTGSNLEMLPFALDSETWAGLLSGSGDDNWKWDSELEEIQAGADGILEVNLYPQGTGSPGNRGTVDIGSSNNSTADISRQIVDGISSSDLDHHGGKLEFGEEGTLSLNGDTGISAGVKDELLSIMGKPRIVPVFSEVTGPGNNAQYTIVQFIGVRIMEVKLTGQQSSKRVIIQPAPVLQRGGIVSETEGTSSNIYSPIWLVR